MESIVSYFSGIGLDFLSLSKLAVILLLGALLISGICRFIFRKTTMIAQAVSSSITIIFIYVVMVLILTLVTELNFLITPLPFATLSPHSITFFQFDGADYTIIASELLSMIILAFLVGLVDSWLPKSKNIFKWTFWRILTITLGFAMHYFVVWVFQTYLPQGIVLYAPVILLGILVLMLLTGALKFLLGLLLATVNPLIGALYTFFFANIIGKQVTRSVLTTALLSGVLVLLQNLEIAGLSLAPEAMVAYIPFLLVLVPIWYLVSRL